ncbi:MAG: restriction endonuclease subunit S [Clostridia bacterium]|nr:restriction endonuclease subunit S [Clostridia bacterium]
MFKIIEEIKSPKNIEKVELPEVKDWKDFTYGELFQISRGNPPLTAAESKKPENQGSTPFAGAAKDGNGITAFINKPATYKENAITVGNSGNGGAGLAFYQPLPFCAGNTVNILYGKDFVINSSIGLFLCAIISQEHYKYNHGQGWGITRMKESKIKLPATYEGKPNWKLIEDYINSLPYSKYI